MALSYLKSRCDDPLVEMGLGQLLDDSAAKWPQRDAFVFKKQGVRVTFAEVKQETDRLAAGLLVIGVRRGDVVAWALGTRPEWIYLCCAVARIGAIALPISPGEFWASQKEMGSWLNEMKPKVLIVENRPTTETFKGAIPYLNEVFPETMSTKTKTLAMESVPTLESIVLLGDETRGNFFYNFEDIRTTGTEETNRKLLEKAQRQTHCHDPFLVLLTSGSTGEPKCVEHSSFAFLNNIRIADKDLGSVEKVLCPTDLASTPWTILHPLNSGCTVVFPSDDFPTPAEIISVLLEERCEATSFFYVKGFHDFVTDPALKEHDLSFLKRVKVGGNVVSKNLLRRAANVLPQAMILNAYATNESGEMAATSSEMTKEQRESTVGQLYQHMEIKLVDKYGQTVPLQQKGEVWVRSYSVFNRYRGDEEKTAEVKTAVGWYKTGDIGILDENSLLKIAGRIKDIIIKDAENIPPTMIEQALLEHPKVLDVKVVSVPDPAYVEEICACIILKKGQCANQRDMRKFSDETWLVGDFSPGYFVFMENFPKTPNGRKVDRKKLRVVAMETLGLQENAE